MMTYRRLQAILASHGKPMTDAEAKTMAVIFRNAIKIGLSNGQAMALVRLTYNSARGYAWSLKWGADSLEHETKLANAAKFPNGKDAEELSAAREGRPSRWGTPEFHRGRVG